jgi:hypothetical protein
MPDSANGPEGQRAKGPACRPPVVPRSAGQCRTVLKCQSANGPECQRAKKGAGLALAGITGPDPPAPTGLRAPGSIHRPPPGPGRRGHLIEITRCARRPGRCGYLAFFARCAPRWIDCMAPRHTRNAQRANGPTGHQPLVSGSARPCQPAQSGRVTWPYGHMATCSRRPSRASVRECLTVQTPADRDESPPLPSASKCQGVPTPGVTWPHGHMLTGSVGPSRRERICNTISRFLCAVQRCFSADSRWIGCADFSARSASAGPHRTS